MLCDRFGNVLSLGVQIVIPKELSLQITVFKLRNIEAWKS